MAMLLSFSVMATTPLKVKVHALTGADARDEDRISRAVNIIEEAVNSEEFRATILSLKFTQTNLSSSQVLTKILDATENFSGGEKNSIDLFLDMYEERSSTVGWTKPSDKFLHMNRYFHKNYSPEETAGNIFHEWLHKIGFNHSKYNNSQRPHSVPYKLGYLMSSQAFVDCKHE